MSTRPSTTRRRSSRVPAAIEPLECRRLLTTLTINGTKGNDLIFVDVTDNGNTFVWTTDNFATQGSFPTAFVDQLNINGLDGNDIIRLERNKFVTTTINAGAGDDFIDYKFLRRNLNDAFFGGDIAAFGGTGTDSIFTYDNDNPASSFFTVDFQKIHGLGGDEMFYGVDIENVSLRTSQFNDTINVQSTDVATKIFLNSAGGNDTVNIGTATGGSTGTDLIKGDLTIDNDAGSTTIDIGDSTSATAKNAFINAFDSGGRRFNWLSGLSPAGIFWIAAKSASSTSPRVVRQTRYSSCLGHVH